MITSKLKVMKNYIGDTWVDAISGEMDTAPNPANGEPIARVPLSSKEDVDQAAKAAKEPYPAWEATPVPNRTRHLFEYLHLFKENTAELTEIINMEHRKSLKGSQGEVQ